MSLDLFRLDGRVALITGGSKGLGEAVPGVSRVNAVLTAHSSEPGPSRGGTPPVSRRFAAVRRSVFGR